MSQFESSSTLKIRTSVSATGTDITTLYLNGSCGMCCENSDNNDNNKEQEQEQEQIMITQELLQECLTSLVKVQRNIIDIERKYNKAITLLEKINDIEYKSRMYHQRSQLRNNYGSVVGGVALLKENINQQRIHQLKRKAISLIKEANMQLKKVYTTINYKSRYPKDNIVFNTLRRNDLQYNSTMIYIGNGLLPSSSSLEMKTKSKTTTTSRNNNTNTATLGQAICERQIKLLTIVVEQIQDDIICI
ncbi:hypothetical protein FRACYDRAFT_250056 [Fragilariopsis cylindrus CCMP1102]|uniref:Uncharacterized protein n=1 Tax=Fragilariopsis cylindrus CCMP1102 TaxID=635003 RepID=A0A1E7ER09_9STRA|nr:hypothetical protein FRACYDRAFT_250056 [Fragilariopsis cylindrus CCMP1102]|eukprot:OEU08267.1 hypothetical protein FRACYDRAFT_250056 [Fragilariopsis cylindrus CCMP1102]